MVVLRVVDQNRTPPIWIEFREPDQFGLSANVFAIEVNRCSALACFRRHLENISRLYVKCKSERTCATLKAAGQVRCVCKVK
jgi:hypothetical protein